MENRDIPDNETDPQKSPANRKPLKKKHSRDPSIERRPARKEQRRAKFFFRWIPKIGISDRRNTAGRNGSRI
jgi:hypothetical protein